MKAVGVFLGASAPPRPTYADAVRRAGRLVAERGLTLVYGGRTGLMGVLSIRVIISIPSTANCASILPLP